MDGWLRDLKHGFRMLVRTPLLSLVSILTIGLGVGGVTFGFSVMYLIQEKQIKGKVLGKLFHRLPPLENIDQINSWLL